MTPLSPIDKVLPWLSEADLLDYVDGRLDPERRRRVEAMLAHNPEAAARVAADLAIMAGLRRLFKGMAPGG